MLWRLLLPLTLPIRSGPLEGSRWSIVSGTRFLWGTYEPANTEALSDLLGEGDVFLDVGAHVGYFTAMASRRVGARGRVYAFEPRPLNHSLLLKHVRINGLENVLATRAAVGRDTGEARFESRTGTGTGRLAADGDLPVRVVSLDDLYLSGALPAVDVMKVDVEGGEADVLSGARRMLEETGPRILLSTHGPELFAECVRILETLGYTCRTLPVPPGARETEVLALPRPAHEAPDGFSGG